MKNITISSTRQRWKEKTALTLISAMIIALIGLYSYGNITSQSSVENIFYSTLLSIALVFAGILGTMLYSYVQKWILFGSPYKINGFIIIPIRALISDDGILIVSVMGSFVKENINIPLNIKSPLHIPRNEWCNIAIEWDDLSYFNKANIIIEGSLGHTNKQLIEHFVITAR